MSISRLMQTASGKRGFDPNTPIGTAIEGGFFAGIITQGGDDYATILAPKASGQAATQIEFKTTNTASPAATQTLNNGPAATAAMVAAGNHPAAAFCAGLTINGFSDWYLPSRDELEICYRNLKPTTGSNNTSDRPLSLISYPEGNDLSADTTGVNRNSNPVGAAYTSGSPSQTSVTNFQTGNSEAFASGGYWSSSEFSNTSAWTQFMTSGDQDSTAINKNDTRFCRAVRRVAI